MENQQTSLFLVPTPIGNLEDITLRALRVLKEVDIVLAEDTRVSGNLLKHYEISKPLHSYHAFNEHKTVDGLVNKMKEGVVYALVTDAGTPAISDPGFLIVRACLEAGIKIESLPGATAFVPALVKSGLPSESFIFEGFLPHKKGKQTKLKQIAEESRTVILYESPNRLVKTLEQLLAFVKKDRKVSVSRELTKKFEETQTGTISEIITYYTENEPKGEIVVVLEGAEKVKKSKNKYDKEIDEED